MRVRRLTLGPLDTNCWIVDDGKSGPAVVIDPAAEASAILSALEGSPVAAVVLTHAHFDHLGATREVRAATGAPLLVHAEDAEHITSSAGTGGARRAPAGSTKVSSRVSRSSTQASSRTGSRNARRSASTPSCSACSSPSARRFKRGA